MASTNSTGIDLRRVQRGDVPLRPDQHVRWVVRGQRNPGGSGVTDLPCAGDLQYLETRILDPDARARRECRGVQVSRRLARCERRPVERRSTFIPNVGFIIGLVPRPGGPAHRRPAARARGGRRLLRAQHGRAVADPAALYRQLGRPLSHRHLRRSAVLGLGARTSRGAAGHPGDPAPRGVLRRLRPPRGVGGGAARVRALALEGAEARQEATPATPMSRCPRNRSHRHRPNDGEVAGPRDEDGSRASPPRHRSESPDT